MKSDTLSTLILAAIFTALVVGGVYYAGVLKTGAEAESQSEASWETLKPRTDTNSEHSIAAPSGRTDTPIKCHDPEVGEFWTNATSCENADLHNRISDSQVIPEMAVRDQYNDQKYEEPEQASKYGADQ